MVDRGDSSSSRGDSPEYGSDIGRSVEVSSTPGHLETSPGRLQQIRAALAAKAVAEDKWADDTPYPEVPPFSDFINEDAPTTAWLESFGATPHNIVRLEILSYEPRDRTEGQPKRKSDVKYVKVILRDGRTVIHGSIPEDTPAADSNVDFQIRPDGFMGRYTTRGRYSWDEEYSLFAIEPAVTGEGPIIGEKIKPVRPFEEFADCMNPIQAWILSAAAGKYEDIASTQIIHGPTKWGDDGDNELLYIEVKLKDGRTVVHGEIPEDLPVVLRIDNFHEETFNNQFGNAMSLQTQTYKYGNYTFSEQRAFTALDAPAGGLQGMSDAFPGYEPPATEPANSTPTTEVQNVRPFEEFLDQEYPVMAWVENFTDEVNNIENIKAILAEPNDDNGVETTEFLFIEVRLRGGGVVTHGKKPPDAAFNFSSNVGNGLDYALFENSAGKKFSSLTSTRDAKYQYYNEGSIVSHNGENRFKQRKQALSIFSKKVITREVEPPFPEEFEEQCSLCADSDEVKTMARLEKSGIPVSMYEFSQGQVDYHNDPNSKSRITLIARDGRRVEFNDNEFFGELQPADIVAVEFFNSGTEGLNPTDTVRIRHSGGDDKTGINGRGTSTALTYLESEGMPVEIESFHQGHRWSGVTMRSPKKRGEPDSARMLRVHGKREGRAKQPCDYTIFRVTNPNGKFLDNLRHLNQTYLHANTRYPEAKLVDPNIDLKPLEWVRHGQGRIAPLNNVVGENDHGFNRVWVDGLRVEHAGDNGTRSALAWAIEGLARDESNYVRRSKDSKKAEGYEQRAISAAVDKLTDKCLLAQIITAGLKWRNRCIELTYYMGMEPDPSHGTREAVQEVWKVDYKDVLITDNQLTAQMAGDSQKVRLIPTHLFIFLKSCGIKTADTVAQKQYEELKTVPDAFEQLDKKDLMGSFLELAAKLGAESADTVEHDGDSYIRLTIDGVTADSLTLFRSLANQKGVILGTGALVGKATSTTTECVSRDDTHEYRVAFSFTQDGDFGMSAGAKEFKVGGTVDDVYMSQATWTKEWAPNKTYLLFQIVPQGTDKGLTPENAAAGKGKFASALANIVQRAKDFRQLGGFDRPKNFKSASALGQGNPRSAEHLKSDSLTPGYYAEEIMDAFGIQHGRAYMTADLKTRPTYVRRRTSVEKYDAEQNAHVIKDLAGVRPLRVKEGHEVVSFSALDGGAVEFLQDEQTGAWSMRGNNGYVVYYTAPIKSSSFQKRFALKPPTVKDKVDVIGDQSHRLSPHWQDLISEARKGDKGEFRNNDEKVDAALRQWGRHFEYSTAERLDEQVHADNPAQAAVNILNLSSGICNIAGSGLFVLLRAMGVPVRGVSGYTKMAYDDVPGSHMWLQYWNGEDWRSIEPQKYVTKGLSRMERDMRAMLSEMAEDRNDHLGEKKYASDDTAPHYPRYIEAQQRRRTPSAIATGVKVAVMAVLALATYLKYTEVSEKATAINEQFEAQKAEDAETLALCTGFGEELASCLLRENAEVATRAHEAPKSPVANKKAKKR